MSHRSHALVGSTHPNGRPSPRNFAPAAAFPRLTSPTQTVTAIPNTTPIRAALLAITLAALCACLAGPLTSRAHASKTQWSMFEEQRYLTNADPATREATLDEIHGLGADTLRILLSWNSVAPSPGSSTRPAFDANDPAAYPGFANYDDLVQRATAKGFRVVLTLAGPMPVWATGNRRGNNYKPDPNEYAQFVAATGKRYSGSFNGLPRVNNYTLLNEPNHKQFLTPQKVHNSPAARSYRDMVARAIPALRASGHADATILIGELAPFPPAGGPGPLAFTRSWLCLDKRYKRLKGSAARKAGCSGFKKIDANGFAIHAYTRPVSNYKPPGDAITIAVIRRLAAALDKAAKAGRIPRGLPIYNTEFGIQTNPPDPYQGGSLAKQAQILNESEEYSYKYSRLRSYSQYLLYDDPPLTSGPAFDRYRGFQSGLEFSNGQRKPAYDAFKFPIVVHKRGSGVSIWGRVRPGSGVRFVQIQRRSGSSFENLGVRIATNPAGYFSASQPGSGLYRFQAFDGAGNPLGTSRVASPVKF